MKIDIKYFGMLAEVTGCSEEQLEFSEATVGELRKVLLNRYPELKTKDFTIAQQQELASDEALITSNEIVLLPPFAGG